MTKSNNTTSAAVHGIICRHSPNLHIFKSCNFRHISFL